MTWTRNPAWGFVDRPCEADHGGVFYAADLTDGTMHQLEGASAAVARAALDVQSRSEVHVAVAAMLGVAEEDIDSDVLQEMLDGLITLGLLLREDRWDSQNAAAGSRRSRPTRDLRQ